jgi:dTDP-glucose 4,6-dehydratase
MDTVVVTGGAGFIGSNFARHVLARSKARLVVLDKLTYAGHLENIVDLQGQPRYAFVKADICDRSALEEAFRRFQPTSVVNFAAESHVDRSVDEPGAFVQTNLVGVYELLETTRRYLAKAGNEVRSRFRFLQVSTDEVYGDAANGPAFTESSPYAPNSPYSATKAGADHLVRAYQATFGVPALITNCSNNYGPYQHPEKLIPLMILNALEGRELPIYGDGENVRDWIFVEDHCAGVLLALQRGKPGERYHIGGRNEQTNLAIVGGICRMLETKLPAKSNPALKARGIDSYEQLKRFVRDRPGHDRRYAIDAEKTRAELGWSARYDLAKGLDQTIDWYLAHRSWCEAVTASGEDRRRRGLAVLQDQSPLLSPSTSR